MKKYMLSSIALLVLALTGCSFPLPIHPTLTDQSRDMVASQAAGQKPIGVRGLDGVLARITERVPGFGGLFINNDTQLIIYLKNLELADKARQIVKELLGDRKIGRGSEVRRLDQVEIIIRQGRFDFRELLRWKNRLKEVLALNSVVFLDVDEAKNRVHIGIEPGADRESVIGLWNGLRCR